MPEYTALQKDYAKYRLDKSKEDLDYFTRVVDNMV